MSALTDVFSALANKIRSKTGGSETYTPAEMVSDGIDDVYDAGVAAGTPTLDGDATTGNVLSGKTFYSNSTTKQTGSMTNNGNFQGDIDPSVSTPYELSSGYYSSVELDVLPHTASSPSSSTYTSLAMGETKSIDLGQYHKYRYVRVQAAAPSGNKAITANGTNIDVSSYATASVSVSGTAITPSNSSPASMTSGTLYTPSANGYAISSYSSVTPSDASPVSLSSGSIYKMSGAGKAVASVTDVTPSADGTYFSSGIKKMSSSGYAYTSQITPGGNVEKLGEWLSSTTSTLKTINLSSPLTNYIFILITMVPYSNGIAQPTSVTSSGSIFATTDYFQNNPITLHFPAGGSGSMSARNVVITYVSSTSITFKRNSSDNRNFYIYGVT